jgi:molecular chaperone Hsp33
VSDLLLKFLFRDAPVRCEIVRIDDTWRRMLAHRTYPAPVTALLGEATAAALLLAANIKFRGALVLQVQGDGPVRLLVVECQSDLTVRATAKLREGASIAPDDGLPELVNRGGHGRCAITLDPQDRRPGQQAYQGIVPLEGRTMADVLETYMRQSEQLDTRLWLAADHAAAAGLLLQRLPASGAGASARPDPDAWDRARALCASLTPDELLRHEPDTLARRLFGQETLEALAPGTPRFDCTCSRERMERTLVTMGRSEAESIVAERGLIEVRCDFCGRRQVFDADAVRRLFGAAEAPPDGPSRPGALPR